MGDLLEADVDALVNAVNCVGVMSKGIALQFKRRFPAMFKTYRAACKLGKVAPGRVHVVPVVSDGTRPRFVVNFPTKRHWREASRLDDLDAGLADLADRVRELGIGSLAIPPLGCGLGGLDWAVVKPQVVSAFAELSDVRVLLFEPSQRVRHVRSTYNGDTNEN